MNSPGLGQNETYVGQRLLFQRAGEVEIGLTDAVSGEDAKDILRQAILGALLIGISSMLFGFVAAAVIGGATHSLELAGGFLVLTSLLPWLWIAVVLFAPRHTVLSDWHLLLDARAPVADTAYGVIYRSLTAERRTPAVVAYHRLKVGPPVPGIRNTLRVTIGKYSSYVSVFPFGNDLYLGWTLWRRDIPVKIVWRWLVSLFGSDPGFSGIIEMEPVKALREAVHNALRQGVEASTFGPPIPLAETFGRDIPVDFHPGGADSEAAPGAMPEVVLVGVRHPVDVYSKDGESLGRAEPGTSYEVIDDDPDAGVTLRDRNGAIAVLKDRSAIQW